MNIWSRRVLGFFAIAGSALGLSPTISLLITGHEGGLIVTLLSILFYLYGAICGVQMLEGSHQYIRNNCIFWCMQIPVVQSSIFSYSVFNGMRLQIALQLNNLYLSTTWNMLGSMFDVVANNENLPTIIGINIFSAFSFIYLFRKI